MKNDRNALIDEKMNQNSDVQIFRRGPTSIPDSRVPYARHYNPRFVSFLPHF